VGGPCDGQGRNRLAGNGLNSRLSVCPEGGPDRFELGRAERRSRTEVPVNPHCAAVSIIRPMECHPVSPNTLRSGPTTDSSRRASSLSEGQRRPQRHMEGVLQEGRSLGLLSRYLTRRRASCPDAKRSLSYSIASSSSWPCFLVNTFMACDLK
jgi:hypothetical protein